MVNVDQIILEVKEQCIRAYVNTVHPVILRHIAKKVGKKDKIEVVFFAMNVPMWRYEGVYKLLSMDNRFNCHIVLTVNSLVSKDSQAEDLQRLRQYFKSKGINFIDHEMQDTNGYDVRKNINPDILFYPQHYGRMHPENHNYTHFLSKLLCYIPYGVSALSSRNWSWQYDLTFQNFAWKLYYPFSYNKKESEAVSKNHARNMVISGYPNMDYYLNDTVNDVWKLPTQSHKRLIWAPHFTIADSSALNRSNFLQMSQLMLDVAESFRDKLQIAFKPHPRLKLELYMHPEWGKEKTDLYYNKWAGMENTMLETGDFIDLFKSSDAMIHDSGSFMIEYMFVNKPVAFVVKDLSTHEELSDFGQEILNQHYLVKDKEEIISFIENVVLGGNDTKCEQRTEFLNKQLMPNINGTTSQFIVNDIKRSLGIEVDG